MDVYWASDQVLETFVIGILNIVLYIWEIYVSEFNIWLIPSHICMAALPQGMSLPEAQMKTGMKGVGFHYTDLSF